MPFTPYLHFKDTCAEAMAFYADVFGGSDLVIMKFSDAPPEVGMGDSDLIMHSSFTLPDGTMLMASDTPPSMPAAPQQSVSISYMCATVDEAQAIYDRLNKGGEPVMPFGPTFFSQGFGMTKDRFGTHWMVMGPEAG